MFSETIARFLIDHVGRTIYFGFVAVLLLGVPVAIASAGLISFARGTGGQVFGLILGLAVGAWASLCDDHTDTRFVAAGAGVAGLRVEPRQHTAFGSHLLRYTGGGVRGRLRVRGKGSTHLSFKSHRFGSHDLRAPDCGPQGICMEAAWLRNSPSVRI